MPLLVACLFLLVFVPAAAADPGDLDTSFGSQGWLLRDAEPRSITHLFAQEDGRIVLGGNVYASYRYSLSRLLPDGSVDPSFSSDGTVDTELQVDSLAIADEADRIVVVGRRVDNGAFAARRYLPDGTLDATFGGGTVDLTAAAAPDGFRQIAALANAPDNGVVVVISRPSYSPGRDVTLVRLLEDGSPDPSFGDGGTVRVRPGGRVGSGINDVFVRRDGRIVGAGFVQDEAETISRPLEHWPMLLRLRRDGQLDRGFGRRGVAVHRNPDDAGPLELIVRGEGTRVTALHAAASRMRDGWRRSIVLRGFYGDGRIDRSFGRRGMGRINLPPFYDENYWEFHVPALTLQPDGKFLLIGDIGSCGFRGPCYAQPLLARFTPFGDPDREFGRGGLVLLSPPVRPTEDSLYDVPDSYALLRSGDFLPDERLVVGGSASSDGLVGRLLDVVAPRLASSLPRRQRLRAGRPVRLTLECEEAGSRCDGRIRLYGSASGRRYSAGEEAFTLTPGQESTVTISLTRRAERQLARRGRLVAQAVLQLRDEAGNSRTLRRRIALTRTRARASTAAAPTRFFGMHADQAFEARDAEREEILRSVRSSGAGSVRQQLDWSRVEREPGMYDWSEFDDYVEAVARADLDLIPILIAPPAFRSKAPAEPKRGLYAPRRAREFGAFAAAAVARYGSGGSFWAEHPDVAPRPVRDWQVWNEPSLAYFWRPRPNARGFGSMLRVVARAIRRADPHARVLAPALPESRYGVPLMRFLSRMSAAAGRGGYDVAAVNPYAGSVGEMMGLLRQTRRWLDRHGRRRVRISVSEFGWASFDHRDEWIQAQRVGEAVSALASARRRLRLSGALHYSWQDADPFPGGADFWGIHTGLLDRAGRPKAAWHAFSREVGRVTR